MAEKKILRPRHEAIVPFHDDLAFRRVAGAIRLEMREQDFDFDMMYWPFEIGGAHKLLDNGRLRAAEYTVGEYKEEEFDG